VPSIVGVVGVGCRSVPNDSLSILKMDRVGLVPIFNPIESSLQNDSVVLVVEFQTLKHKIVWVTANLDLINLGHNFNSTPVVF
jgi:hypothetical protein